MITKINKIVAVSVISYLLPLTSFLFFSCSDQFLQDKKNYDNVTTDVYNYVEGANARLNDIYGWCLPQVADLTTGTNYLSVSIGNNDAAGGATEEYAGFTILFRTDFNFGYSLRTFLRYASVVSYLSPKLMVMGWLVTPS